MKRFLSFAIAALVSVSAFAGEWIRINQLGYLPKATKVAVYMSNDATPVESFRIVDVYTGETVFTSSPEDIRATGAFGQMAASYRLNFSELSREGAYRIEAGKAQSPIFPVGATVYDGAADFVLNYMRQQRCGWNPMFMDNCHQNDATIIYHPTKSGQHLDVRGGWHDASDCLQYTTTSANAIYQMMFAYQQNPEAFGDAYQANGTPGANGIPDIIDEIYWGMDWLDRMNPGHEEYYNQIADDRDHIGMRMPNTDPADYGWGPGAARPVYFVSGEPQQQGKGMNKTVGVSSTVGKFASCFAMGSEILAPFYPEFAKKIGDKAAAAYEFGKKKPGVHQTASVVSPYIYEEVNWVDDMELGAMELYLQTGDPKYKAEAIEFGRQEPVTPWMGADSARHYQWYPFMNMGHVRIAQEGGRAGKEFVRNLRSGIERTFVRAQDSPFLNGIPSIWCSNNLTTAMITQCILYRQITGDTTFEEMEGSLRDWLFGCNPWGTSMIIQLPEGGVYPTQPHSFVIQYGLGNTTGGIVDGPVYATIFGSLLGISTEGGKNYEEFQPGNMVYHDSIHDYSNNEPTMDGTACLTFPLSAYSKEGHEQALKEDKNIYDEGGIVRTDPSKKRISLVFTAADMADGADPIISALKKEGIQGSFFFTGEFFERFPDVVRRLIDEGHYVGSHSDGHLLYSPWENRDSLLVTKEEFIADILKSYERLAEFGITRDKAPYFLPPYEYYNSTVSSWTRQLGLKLVNFTNGTYTNADYTTPDMKNYRSSKFIYDKVMEYERTKENGLNGHIMLIHFGTVDARKDKFYNKLPTLIRQLERKGYEFVPLAEAIGD